jgi:hypothetical protein
VQTHSQKFFTSSCQPVSSRLSTGMVKVLKTGS